ncbi:uncharacterized protein LAJ45_01245 [Morchella importuna]|uniref:uncharacterized protein n=1 Tax=Morchella importuna TaxID=1174673 RepID=UPI001E8ECBDA|nr:uncharacterized protein LAJ45_01245 [Morchella importuna]KAH8154714.1 hypothetical protein LAJ45_01245 [Morchella importuna]
MVCLFPLVAVFVIEKKTIKSCEDDQIYSVCVFLRSQLQLQQHRAANQKKRIMLVLLKYCLEKLDTEYFWSRVATTHPFHQIPSGTGI